MTGPALLGVIAASPADDLPRRIYADYLDEFGDEDAWQSYLDAYPDDHAMRTRLGLWLSDQGDVRGDGYRALAKGRRAPLMLDRYDGTPHHWYVNDDMVGGNPNSLPPDWFNALPGAKDRYVFWPAETHAIQRRAAEDAAALAFHLLPADRQRELMETT